MAFTMALGASPLGFDVRTLIMRFAALVITSLLALALAGCAVAPAAKHDVQIAHLPVEQVFPLEGEQCGCMSFRTGAQQAKNTAFFSFTPTQGRLRMNGQNLELRQATHRTAAGGHVNEFAGSGVRASLTAKEVPFTQACSPYPEPPVHGSCFVGTLDVKAEQGSESMQVVQLCGC